MKGSDVMKKVLLFIISMCLLFLAAGCSTYQNQSAKMTKAWQAGDGWTAVTNATLKVDKSVGRKDELIWRLEQGTIFSAVGEVEESLAAFDAAEALVDQYENEAKLQLGDQAGALLSNQASLTYRGRAYDKVMLNTYKALNYLLHSQPAQARVELNRSLQRQRNAVEENNKKITKSLAEAEQAKAGEIKDESGKPAPSYDLERAQQDATFSAAADVQLADLDTRMLSYADYVNPFSVFVDGLFFSHLGLDNSDIERARKSFERVKGMSPGRYITEDYAMVDAMGAGGTAEPLTYVLFATGTAPSRRQIRIDIPLFLLTDEISYIGAAFPKLEYHDNYIEQITATAGGQSFSSENLCSMDAVISRDFKNEWPIMMTKTLLTTATKALIGKVAEDTAKKSGNQWAHLAAKAASVSYQAATNIADLRTWTTLPKNFAYIRMPTPAAGSLQLTIGAVEQTVDVAPGKINILMVRSVNDTALPIIETFTLN